ncbi:cat eye syndrome critical region protein 2 homolog [Nematostella vectensis]|uniref:cat eye syndrome critical region protein 2 homolog n=1 Tax=Nematostella vectensis TaxID=45351 RepID=UPI0020777816|nr:cat eye syndrome critical region protein 2 homolog [Nematostella vectensis]
MEDIRSWWEVPSIAHFCSLFRTAFGLTDFEIEDLEDALLLDGSKEDSYNRFLADLHASLLKGLFTGNKDINADNFEPYLSEVLKIRWQDELGKPNPLSESPYSQLTTQQKVEILHDLCDFRLDVGDVPDLLKGLDADSLRVEPLGTDASGNVYWYFYGTRLYKETPEVSQEAKDKELKKEKKKKKLEAKKKRKQKKKQKGKKKKRVSSSSESESDFITSSSSEESSEEDTEEENSEKKGPQWMLVCSTATEWEELAESFKKSKNRDEKMLYQTLSEDFVPEITKMIDTKEKALQKKLLLEMAPRRASERIALKSSLRDEEDREDDEEEQLDKERAAESKKQEDEEKEKEKQLVAEKRQKERAERARLREERQWMIANGELSEFNTNSNASSDDNNDENSKDREDLEKRERKPLPPSCEEDRDEDLYTGMYKVLDYLKKHNNAWPFLEPVDESYAPQYHEIIENPMDLSTIEEKLDTSKYATLDEFQSDMKLMFENCLEYNGPDSMYTKMGNTLEAAFNRQIKKHFPEDQENSDEDFEEELRKTRRKEMQKLQKKKGYSVDDFLPEPAMDRKMGGPSMMQAGAGNMPYQFPNNMPMNQMGGNPMMGAGRPPPNFSSFPPGGFGPDGRPMYPPEFYQNMYNAIARYGVPPQQFNQYPPGYTPPHLTRAPMGGPQGIGYPQGVQGRMPYPRPPGDGVAGPAQGMQRMPGPMPMSGHLGPQGPPVVYQKGPTGQPPVATSGAQMAGPEASLNVPSSQSSQRLPQGMEGAVRPQMGSPSYPGQFGPQGGVPPRLQGPMGMKVGVGSTEGGMQQMMGYPPRLQRAPSGDQMQRPGQHLPAGFISRFQNPGQASPPGKPPGDQSEAARTPDSNHSMSPGQRTVPVSTSGEPTPSSMTTEKDKRESEQAEMPPRSQVLNQGFPPQQYYNRMMGPGPQQSPYPQGMPRGPAPWSQGRATSVIMSPSTHTGVDKPEPGMDQPSKNSDETKGSPHLQEQDNQDGAQNGHKEGDQPADPASKEAQDAQKKGVGMSIRSILGSPASSCSDSERPSETKPAVVTAPRRSPPPLVSDPKPRDGVSNPDSRRSSPALDQAARPPSQPQERPTSFKSWPPPQLAPGGGAQPKSFLEELFNGAPPGGKEPVGPEDDKPAEQRMSFTSLLKEMAPNRESPKKGSFVDLDMTTERGPERGMPPGMMSRNFMRTPEEAQRYSHMTQQMGPYTMYQGKRTAEGIPPLQYHPSAAPSMAQMSRQHAYELAAAQSRSPKGQFMDLDSRKFLEQPGFTPTSHEAYSREHLYLLQEQQRRQQVAASSRNSIMPGGQGMPPHMMGYPGNVMLRQQQMLDAMYGARVRNGDAPGAPPSESLPSKVARFS